MLLSIFTSQTVRDKNCMRSFCIYYCYFLPLKGKQTPVISDSSRPKTESVNPIPSDAQLFDDVTSDVGLNFTHYNGMTGGLFLPELMGSGTVLFDYDNDKTWTSI